MIKNIEQTKDGVDSFIDRTRDGVISSASRAERGAEAAAKGVVETVHTAGEYVREGADKAAGGAHRSVGTAATAIDRGYVQARSDLSRAATATTDYFTENPGKALLIAVSAGFALGLMMTGRRTSV